MSSYFILSCDLSFNLFAFIFFWECFIFISWGWYWRLDMLDIQYGFYQTHLKVGILCTVCDIFMIYWTLLDQNKKQVFNAPNLWIQDFMIDHFGILFCSLLTLVVSLLGLILNFGVQTSSSYKAGVSKRVHRILECTESFHASIT